MAACWVNRGGAELRTLKRCQSRMALRYEIVGSGEPRHLAAGTGVETVKSVRGVFAYAAKYLAKVEDDPATEYESIGRCWGIMGREHLPWATIVEMSLSYEHGLRLKRAAVRYLKSKRDKKKRYH